MCLFSEISCIEIFVLVFSVFVRSRIFVYSCMLFYVEWPKSENGIFKTPRPRDGIFSLLNVVSL